MFNLLPQLFGSAQSLASLFPTDQGPPPPPSMMTDPSVQSAFGGMDQTLASMAGMADQFRGRPGQLGQSPSYYGGLTSGGTNAQNDRFSRMWDQDALSASVAQQLAQEMPGLFGGGNASVTPLGNSSAPVPEITNDTISQMLNSGAMDGQASGVRLAPEQQSQALERRLAQRAESQANLANMRYSASDFIDPVDKFKMAYEMYAAEQDALAAQEKNSIARMMMQAEIDARNQSLSQDQSQFDATMDWNRERARMQGQSTMAQNALEQQRWLKEFGLDEQRLNAEIAATQRADELGIRDILEFVMGEGGAQLGGPQQGLAFLDSMGVDMPEGFSLPTTPTLGGGSSPGFATLFGGMANDETRAQLATMDPEEAFRYLRTTGARGRPLSEAEALAVVQELHPELIGSTPRNPAGISVGGAIGGGLAGGVPGALLGSGADMGDVWKYLFGGAPASPAPASASFRLPETPMAFY